MRPEILLLFLAVGLGNYLMRYLPLLWALRREEPGAGAGGRLPNGLLAFVGPSVVAALLVTSVLPGMGSGEGLVRTAVALLPTVLVAARSGNLGLTVLTGVAAYWAASLVV